MMFKKLIKISNKTFNDLNAEEVALMIEADSSLSKDGNGFFSSGALDEFLYSTRVTRADLLDLRAYIINGIYVQGSYTQKINTEFLLDTAQRVRDGRICISATP